ncbi:GTP-binding protein rho1 [Zopfochytrium polystomum]|nr:GTP-binding protein rho1 [Zopfochytrium polystomum]
MPWPRSKKSRSRPTRAEKAKLIGPKKLVAIGDPGASLLISFASGRFPEEFVPKVLSDVLDTDVRLENGSKILLYLWDSSAKSQSRPLSYPATNVFLFCFSIASPASLARIEYQWLREVQHYFAEATMILVGCKKDLREDQATIEALARENKHPVTFEEGLEMAKNIGAFRYVECSAKYSDGLDKVFEREDMRNLPLVANSKPHQVHASCNLF